MTIGAQPAQKIRPTIILALCLVLAACGGDAVPMRIPDSGGIVNLAEQLPGEWDRVCILTPYAQVWTTKDVLGFYYLVELHSSIVTRDDISLLVTARGDAFVGAYEVSRADKDFTTLGQRCFARPQAVFRHETTTEGWHRLTAVADETMNVPEKTP